MIIVPIPSIAVFSVLMIMFEDIARIWRFPFLFSDNNMNLYRVFCYFSVIIFATSGKCRIYPITILQKLLVNLGSEFPPWFVSPLAQLFKAF